MGLLGRKPCFDSQTRVGVEGESPGSFTKRLPPGDLSEWVGEGGLCNWSSQTTHHAVPQGGEPPRRHSGSDFPLCSPLDPGLCVALAIGARSSRRETYYILCSAKPTAYMLI